MTSPVFTAISHFLRDVAIEFDVGGAASTASIPVIQILLGLLRSSISIYQPIVIKSQTVHYRGAKRTLIRSIQWIQKRGWSQVELSTQYVGIYFQKDNIKYNQNGCITYLVTRVIFCCVCAERCVLWSTLSNAFAVGSKWLG